MYKVSAIRRTLILAKKLFKEKKNLPWIIINECTFRY